MKALTKLNELLKEIKHTTIKPEQIKSIEDAISMAMSMTTVYVGEALLQQEGLLLPDVHNFFLGVCPAKEQGVSARWVLSNLTTTLKHHLSYVCKIRKCGTLLYRSNGDILLALTNALHKLHRPAVAECTPRNVGESVDAAHTETDCMKIALNDISSAMHDQIQVFLKEDAKCPYHFDQVDISSLVSQINPTLWRAICTITQSVAERRGKGTVSDVTHVRTVRHFFCLCALMFCTNDRCCTPMHNLITDMVDGLGGSTLLVKILNRLGVCSSADTLARAIQYRVSEREKKGPQSDCSPTAFTIISIDNIDFLHNYARVFCGDQKRSWHGTTIQLVQPQPTNLHECYQSQRRSMENHTGTHEIGMAGQLECSAPMHDNQPVHVHRRRKCDTDRPYASPSSKSPIPKIRRRARSAMETHKLLGVSNVQEPSLCVSQPNMHALSVSDFKHSAREISSVHQLSHDMYTYLWLEHNLKSGIPSESFVGLQDYCALTRPTEDEKSCIIYFDVLDAIADKKETVLLVLDKLRKQIVEAHQKEWLVVAGDAKLYDVLKTIKYEYGDEFTWLICYPGDWHMLANYQRILRSHTSIFSAFIT